MTCILVHLALGRRGIVSKPGCGGGGGRTRRWWGLVEGGGGLLFCKIVASGTLPFSGARSPVYFFGGAHGQRPLEPAWLRGLCDPNRRFGQLALYRWQVCSSPALRCIMYVANLRIWQRCAAKPRRGRRYSSSTFRVVAPRSSLIWSTTCLPHGFVGAQAGERI